MPPVLGAKAAAGRIVQAVDFERVLKVPAAARSIHFAVHHVCGSPARFRPKLSTGEPPTLPALVDDVAVQRRWLGYVVPKRHARRAVTRSLLKRQIRAAVLRVPMLAAGLWVVRLRSGFDSKLFPSAASPVLARAARAELDGLLSQAALRTAARPG